MNIFKILGSGDGSIKEPNLSAFLGYILNPKADHGLSSAFLEKILEPFLEIKSDSNPIRNLFSNVKDDNVDDLYILDLSVHSRFNVEVVLEKAFKRRKQNGEDEKKEIVDIFIKITERKKTGNENISYLFSKEEPVALLLIENKINHDENVIEQLSNQYKASLNDLPKHIINDAEWQVWQKKICTVLIAPFNENLHNRFKDFKSNNEGNPNSVYITWGNGEAENDNSIKATILDLLEQNNNGEIAPVPTYTIDTLRALVHFINDDFSSDVDDQQEGGKTKIFTPYSTLEDAITNGKGNFSKMSEGMKDWIRRLDEEIRIKHGCATFYSKDRITVKHKGKLIWFINYQKDKSFRVDYYNTPEKYKDIGKLLTPPLERPAYRVMDINIQDSNSANLALETLEYALEYAKKTF